MKLYSEPAVVDERAARLVAGAVASILIVSFAVGQRWPVPILAAGFIARVGWGARFSVLARAAGAVSRALGPPKWVARSPKRFAQGVGATCLLACSALIYGGWLLAGWGVAAIVVGCAILEASLGVCVGCWMYGQLMKLGVVHPSVCLDCAPARRTP